MKLKLLELNVNHKAGNNIFGSKCKELVKQIDCILNEQADIIILTEYHPFEEKGVFYLANEGCQVMENFLSEYEIKEVIPWTNENGILVALRKEKIIFGDYFFDGDINWLDVSCKIGSIDIKIAGFRLAMNGDKNKDLKEKYIEAFEDFKNVFSRLKHLPEDQVIIGAGDFNNGKIHGSRSKKYVEVEAEYNGLAQQPYNYHIIKDYLKNIGISLITPNEGFSVLSGKYKSVIDHAFSKNIQHTSSCYKTLMVEDDCISDHNALIVIFDLNETIK